MWSGLSSWNVTSPVVESATKNAPASASVGVDGSTASPKIHLRSGEMASDGMPNPATGTPSELSWCVAGS